MVTEHQVLDAQGLSCPMPIIKCQQTLKTMEGGQVLLILASDDAFLPDIESWCRKTGNELLSTEEANEELYKAWVRKAQ